MKVFNGDLKIGDMCRLDKSSTIYIVRHITNVKTDKDFIGKDIVLATKLIQNNKQDKRMQVLDGEERIHIVTL